MSFQGSGTGAVTYQIGDGPVVTASECKVEAVEDGSPGTLTLSVSFTDPDYGVMQIAITVFDYTPAKRAYSGSPGLSVETVTETPSGGWVSGAESTAFLYISRMTIDSAVVYSGFFDAVNLIWKGSETEDPLTIGFSNFSFSVSPAPSVTADSQPYWISGGGVGSITYTFGQSSVQTQSIIVTSNSFYTGTTIYAVQLTMTWSDPVQGNCWLMITVNPFTGTGIYTNTDDGVVALLLWSQAASPGNWECGRGFAGVSLNAIYSQTGNVTSWQGSLMANGIPRQDGPQPPVDLDLSALTLTIHQAG